MTDHIYLRIDKATTAGDIDHFLLKARGSGESLGALHLRAYETTETIVGGAQCKVTILYLRSGRESPLEWLRNTLNRKSQYALAAKVLNVSGKFDVDAIQAPPRVNSTCPTFKAAATSVKPVNNKSGILLSKFFPQFVPAPPISQLAPVPLNPGDSVKNQQIGHADCLGRDMGSNTTANALSSSRALVDSMTQLRSAPLPQNNFAAFLGMTDCNPDELEENFESFTSLAVELYDSELSDSEFAEHIKKKPVLASLLLGAAQFTLHWAKCWDLNTDLHNEMPYSQVAVIDRFVTWIAKNYLSQRVDCDALEALAHWSPPASELVDVRGLTVLAGLKKPA